MSWLVTLGERAGPFAGAAQRMGAAPPRGPAGVRALVAALDAFLDDEAADEDAFLARAGAYFACLLVDALGGTHVAARDGHRVQLGTHALFDPFSVIDDAIEAGLAGEEPAEVIAAALLRAEADARDEGAEARAQRALLAALGARPARRVVRGIGWAAQLDDGSELALERLAPLVDDDAALARGAASLVALLPGGSPTALGWKEAAPRLRPRLVGGAFVTELGAKAEALAFAPLAPGLYVAHQLAYDGRARFVRQAEWTRWESAAGAGAVRTQALANLALRAPVWVLEHGLLHARTGDGLDGTRLLLPGLAAQIRAQLGAGPHLLAAPHRDLLLAAPPSARESLAAHAGDAFARAPHGISPRVYRRRAGRVEAA